MNGTSGDVFSEWIVLRKMSGKQYGIMTLGGLAALAITVAIFVIQPGLIAIAIAAWFGAYFLARMQKAEFEYTFTSGDLDIDQLSGDLRRKRKCEIPKESVELVAPLDSDYVQEYKNLRTYDYSSGDRTSKNRYVIIATVKNERARVIFEPNEKMLDNMWKYFPSKVKKAQTY